MKNVITSSKLVVMLILFLACAMEVNAQKVKTKIKFRNLSWEEAMKVATKEKKFIFVDAYRTPCDQCDQAMAEVFSVDSIANLYNDNFVSIRIDMNSDAGRVFAPKLQMLMYPAYVFFSADGEQLGSSNAWAFIKDHGQAMYQANMAITQGNIRRNNTRSIAFAEMSWEAILAKSKKENKPIFVDMYTTWCRPCIQMDRNVFTLNHVADFYNENFINVKMNAEKGEGVDIQKKFNVRGFPTYLYLDGNGELVSSTSGYTEAPEFIGYGKEALKIYAEKQAESKGIQFEHASWKEVLAKAKAENKLIFFDAYTTWCGPCKMMAKNVFTNDTIADFFNANFVNAKFDMEKGEGIDLKNQYGIRAYPTYIYIDGDGNEVHRTVGSTSVKKFRAYAEDALSDDRTLSYLESQYNSGNHDPELVKGYLTALKTAYKSDEMGVVAAQYLDGLKGKELLSEGNWMIIKDYLNDAEAKSFAYLVKKRAKFYNQFDKKEVDSKIYDVYLQGARKYVTVNDDTPVFDEAGFNKYIAAIDKSGVENKERIITYAKINMLHSRREWTQYAAAVDEGLANGNVQKTSFLLYNYALTMKRVGDTPELFSKGADWAKMAGEAETNKVYAVNYYKLQAELLEKAGKTEEAKVVRASYKQEDVKKAEDMNPMKALIIKK